MRVPRNRWRTRIDLTCCTPRRRRMYRSCHHIHRRRRCDLNSHRCMWRHSFQAMCCRSGCPGTPRNFHRNHRGHIACRCSWPCMRTHPRSCTDQARCIFRSFHRTRCRRTQRRCRLACTGTVRRRCRRLQRRTRRRLHRSHRRRKHAWRTAVRIRNHLLHCRPVRRCIHHRFRRSHRRHRRGRCSSVRKRRRCIAPCRDHSGRRPHSRRNSPCNRHVHMCDPRNLRCKVRSPRGRGMHATQCGHTRPTDASGAWSLPPSRETKSVRRSGVDRSLSRS